jgi:hypothetical protein
MWLNNRGLLAGILLIFLGLFVTVYAQRWNFGSFIRMGPAFLPVLLGIALAGLGVGVLIEGLRRPEQLPAIEWRSLFFVCMGIVIFAILARAGLVYATFLAALVASYAEPDSRLPSRVLASAVITVVVALVFVKGLGVRLPLF